MLDANGVLQLDERSGVPLLHISKWNRLSARLNGYPETYEALFGRYVALGMPAEPRSPIIQSATIVTESDGVVEDGRPDIVNGYIRGWQVRRPPGDAGEWYSETIPFALNVAIEWQVQFDYPETPALDALNRMIAKIGLWQLDTIWRIVGWRQRLELEGENLEVIES